MFIKKKFESTLPERPPPFFFFFILILVFSLDVCRCKTYVLKRTNRNVSGKRKKETKKTTNSSKTPSTAKSSPVRLVFFLPFGCHVALCVLTVRFPTGPGPERIRKLFGVPQLSQVSPPPSHREHLKVSSCF